MDLQKLFKEGYKLEQNNMGDYGALYYSIQLLKDINKLKQMKKTNGKMVVDMQTYVIFYIHKELNSVLLYHKDELNKIYGDYEKRFKNAELDETIVNRVVNKVVELDIDINGSIEQYTKPFSRMVYMFSKARNKFGSEWLNGALDYYEEVLFKLKGIKIYKHVEPKIQLLFRKGICLFELRNYKSSLEILTKILEIYDENVVGTNRYSNKVLNNVKFDRWKALYYIGWSKDK